MEKFWKWLMKMDARGIFVISVVLLLAAGTWSAYTIIHADDKAVEVVAPARTTVPLKFNSYQPVGVIGFVSNQFAAETLVLPINPFHPTFESIVRSIIAKGGTQELKIPGRHGQIVAPRSDQKGGQVAGSRSATAAGKKSGGSRGASRATGRPGTSGSGGKGAGARPDPAISFKGMMQRPDGQFAAYIYDNERGAKFVVVGDKVRNAKVLRSGKDGVELEFPNGLRVSLGLGDPPWVIGTEGRE